MTLKITDNHYGQLS